MIENVYGQTTGERISELEKIVKLLVFSGISRERLSKEEYETLKNFIKEEFEERAPYLFES